MNTWTGARLPQPALAEIDAVARSAYDRCHPDDSFDEMAARARFSKEDKGLLRDWRAAARSMIGCEKTGASSGPFAQDQISDSAPRYQGPEQGLRNRQAHAERKPVS